MRPEGDNNFVVVPLRFAVALCCPILYPLRFCPFGATCTPEGGKAHRAKAKRTGGGTAKRRQRLSSLVVRFALPLRFASPLGKRRNKRQRKQRPKETNGKGNGSCPPMVLPFRFAPRRGQQRARTPHRGVNYGDATNYLRFFARKGQQTSYNKSPEGKVREEILVHSLLIEKKNIKKNSADVAINNANKRATYL